MSKPKIKSEYDIMKIETEEFKKKILTYFKKPRYDVTLSELFKELKLDLEDLNFLQYCLDELADEGIIKKSSCVNYFEYDLSEDYGGIH